MRLNDVFEFLFDEFAEGDNLVFFELSFRPDEEVFPNLLSDHVLHSEVSGSHCVHIPLFHFGN